MLQATKKSDDKVDSIVHLMESWKNAREAMGCPIKAAHACPAFEQFLDRKEKKKLLLVLTVLMSRLIFDTAFYYM